VIVLACKASSAACHILANMNSQSPVRSHEPRIRMPAYWTRKANHCLKALSSFLLAIDLASEAAPLLGRIEVGW
jgi:hypothetical protein